MINYFYLFLSYGSRKYYEEKEIVKDSIMKWRKLAREYNDVDEIEL